MARLEAPVMNTRRRAPAASASSTAYWIKGLSTTGSISLGLALVAGRNRVPIPATGNTAIFTSFTTALSCGPRLREQTQCSAAARVYSLGFHGSVDASQLPFDLLEPRVGHRRAVVVHERA